LQGDDLAAKTGADHSNAEGHGIQGRSESSTRFDVRFSKLPQFAIFNCRFSIEDQKHLLAASGVYAFDFQLEIGNRKLEIGFSRAGPRYITIYNRAFILNH
jgi:hypothetical protein